LSSDLAWFFSLLIPSSSNQIQQPFPFAFSLFLLALFTSPSEVDWRRRNVPEAEVLFLSSLVLSPSSAQAAAKDLWSVGLSPQAEAEV